MVTLWISRIQFTKQSSFIAINKLSKPYRITVKRKEYGEFIRKDGEGKWKYQLKRIKLEADHCHSWAPGIPASQEMRTHRSRRW